MQRPVAVAQTPLLTVHNEHGKVEGVVVGRRRPGLLLVVVLLVVPMLAWLDGRVCSVGQLASLTFPLRLRPRQLRREP